MSTRAEEWHSEVKGYLDKIRVQNLPREEEQQLMFYVQKRIEKREEQSIYHPHQFSDELSLNSLNATRVVDKTNLTTDDTTESHEISQAKQNLSNKENESPKQESTKLIKNTLPKPLKRVSFSSTINSAYPTSDHRNSLEKIQSENEASSFKVPLKSPQKSVLSPKRNSVLLSPKAIINSPNRSAQMVKKSLEKSDMPRRSSNLSVKLSPTKEKSQNLSSTLRSPKNQSFGSPNKTHQMSPKNIFASPKFSPVQPKSGLSPLTKGSPSRSAKMINKSLEQSFNSALPNKTEETVDEINDMNLQENDIFKPTRTLNRSLPLNKPVDDAKAFENTMPAERKSEQPPVKTVVEKKSTENSISHENTPKKRKLSEQPVNAAKNLNESSPERKKSQTEPRQFLSPKNSPLLKKIADKKMTEAFSKPNNSALEELDNNYQNNSLNTTAGSCVTRSAAKCMDIEMSIEDPSPFKDSKMNAAYRSLFPRAKFRSASFAKAKNKLQTPNHSSPVRQRRLPSKSEAILPKESCPALKLQSPIRAQIPTVSEQSSQITCGFADSRNYSEITIEPLETTTGYAVEENLVLNSFKDMTCGFVIYDPPHVPHPGVTVKKLPTYVDMGINVNMSEVNDQPEPVNNNQLAGVSIAPEQGLHVSDRQISASSPKSVQFKDPSKIAQKMYQTPPDIDLDVFDLPNEPQIDDRVHESIISIQNTDMNKSNIFSFTPCKDRNLEINKSLLEESLDTQAKNFNVKNFKTKNSIFEVLSENARLIRLTIDPNKKLKVRSSSSNQLLFKKMLFEIESGKLEFGNSFGPQYTGTKGDIVEIDYPEMYYIKNLYRKKGVVLCKSFLNNNKQH